MDKDGNVTALKEGSVSVEVTAKYKGETATETVDFTVVPAPVYLQDFVLDLECGDAAIGVNKTTQATLKAVYSDGHEEVMTIPW